MPKLRNSVLITGTSSGFGLLTAVTLAEKGYRVYGTMRDLSKQDKLLTECVKNSVSIEVRQLDVTKPETIEPVIEEIQQRENGPDILINNAGFGFGGFFEDTSNENFKEQLTTNFFGALNCTRAVLTGMQSRRKGLILNISSIAGLSGAPTLSAYTASKFALEGWSECLRYELSPWGISVVLVEPGTFKTDIFSEQNKRRADGTTNKDSPYYKVYPEIERDLLAKVARFGQDPQRVANTIASIVAIEYPDLRYSVGIDAKLESYMKRLLPGTLFEKIMRHAIWGRYLKMINA